MTKYLLAGVSLACLLAACGGGNKADQPDSNGSNTVPDDDFTITVEPLVGQTLSSGISGSVSINVVVSRGVDLVDPIALTASGLPAGVTATFDDTSLPQSGDHTTLALSIDVGASAGTTDITVTGTAGSNTHSATIPLELHTQTVTGKVRGNAAGVTVRMVGKDAVVSDASGNFTFTDVKVPYDLYSLGQSGPDNAPIPTVNYYKGLTRLDPVVNTQYPYCTGALCPIDLGNTKSATIDGAKLGAGTLAGPTYWKFTTAGDGKVNTTGAWTYSVGWFAAFANNTRVGRLQGMQATRGADNRPTGWYWAQSPTDITLTNGQTTGNVDLLLATLGTTFNLTGTITPPTGFATPTVLLTQTMAGWGFQVWTATTTDATSVIPSLSGQKASFYAISTGTTGSSEGVAPNLAASTDVSMMLPLPASVTGPVSGATNVTLTTPFTFMTPPGQVYEVSMRSSAAIYWIYTTSGTLTIPDLDEMALPSATTFDWQVNGYGPFSTGIEASADPVALQRVSTFEDAGALHYFTSTPNRSFTTQ